MKKSLIAVTLLFFVMAQADAQIKLGNNPTTINADALLEIESTNKGLLLPRVALTNTTAFAPLTAHVAGMSVYNTATAGDVTPGNYYNDGSKWVRIASAAPAASVTGTLFGAYNPIGTTNLLMAAGDAEADVPGVTQTFTLTQAGTVNIIATGIISNFNVPTVSDIQGSFKINVDGTNVTAGFASSGNRTGLGSMPTPITLSYNVVLAAGTHTIKLSYKPWYGGANLNLDAFTAPYAGSVAIDSDALKSRMSILIFNN
ncbi:MAG: hypothetical protein RL329_2526 [Bacteroidota bacterium]|jgi:hypothetical protein